MTAISSAFAEDFPSGRVTLRARTHADRQRAILLTIQGDRVELTEVDIDFLRRALAALPRLEPVLLVAEPGPARPEAPASGAVSGAVSAPRPIPRDAAEPVSPPRPERAGKRWTAEEDEQLRQLLADGTRVEGICAVLQRSPAAIISRLYTLGLIEVRPVTNPGEAHRAA
jgi:hypothetical protein